MDRLEAEQEHAYNEGLERMAKEKDEIISDPVVLDSIFMDQCIDDRLELFELIKQLYELSTPVEQWYSFRGEIQLRQILDTLVDFSNHIEGMVEEYVEDNSELIQSAKTVQAVEIASGDNKEAYISICNRGMTHEISTDSHFVFVIAKACNEYLENNSE